MRRTAGAIFHVSVPETISRSAWRGVARITSIPKRATSKRDMAEAIISKTQQARPNATGQTAERRPQFRRASTDVTAMLPLRSEGTSMIGSGKASWALHLSCSIASPSIRSGSQPATVWP